MIPHWTAIQSYILEIHKNKSVIIWFSKIKVFFKKKEHVTNIGVTGTSIPLS